MAKIFISPCGTSLLTNNTDKDLRDFLFANANKTEAELTTDERGRIDNHIEERRNQLINESPDLATAQQLSAELNGIITYYEENHPGQMGNHNQDIHYLVATDTYQGQATANMVKDWLQQYGITAYVEEIQYLATNNLENFRLAMSDLVDWCNEKAQSYPQPHYELVFNLTGGFKSVNGFLQAIGMFYGAEIVYIFQFSNQLLTIPRLPITFNTEETVGKHLDIFRKLGLNQCLSSEECIGIPETLLSQVGDEVELSAWGKLVWQQAKEKYYGQFLLKPLGDNLVYSEHFKRDVNGIVPDRLRKLNERLDQLWLYLKSGTDGNNLRSLNFHTLRGNPRPPSTHECYVWSGEGSRLYGHFFEGNKYIVDRLGEHL